MNSGQMNSGQMNSGNSAQAIPSGGDNVKSTISAQFNLAQFNRLAYVMQAPLLARLTGIIVVFVLRQKWLSLVVVILAARTVQAGPFDRATTLFGPVSEWSVANPSYSGNPYDLDATVTFEHDGSGTTHTTQMFYNESNMWKFRFTDT